MVFGLTPTYLLNQHEFSLNAGSTYNECTSTTIDIPAGSFHQLDDVLIRVKQIGGDTAGDTLNNILPYFAPQVEKLPNAERIDPRFWSGQSNVPNKGNGINITDADGAGYKWDNHGLDAPIGDELVPYTTANSSSIFVAQGPAFAVRHFELTGKRPVIIRHAYGSSSLQDNDNPNNWSENGNYRYEAMKIWAYAINYFRSSPNFIVEESLTIWIQGEQDANINAPTYKQEQISLGEYYEACGAGKTYINFIGRNTDELLDPGYDNINDLQHESVAESTSLLSGFDLTWKFVAWKWMNDSVHIEVQGKELSGRRNAEITNNAEDKYKITTVTTEIAANDNMSAFIQQDVDGVNAVNSGFAPSLVDGAILDVNSSASLYGKGLSIDGIGAYQKIDGAANRFDTYTASAWIRLTETASSADDVFWADLATQVSGHYFTTKNKPKIVVNGVSAQSGIFENNLVGTGWFRFTYSVWFDGAIPTVKFWLNEVVDSELTIAAGSGFTEWTKGTSDSFYIGAAIESDIPIWSTPSAKFEVDDFRLYERVLSDDEVAILADSALYDFLNTPVTPAAPVITNQSNDDNLFEWTATGDVEMNLKGVGYNDAVSPFDVGYNDYAIGEIEIRVKAEGINPASIVASNTIEFTARDQENICKVSMYVRDLLGADTEVVRLKQRPDSVKYKTNVTSVSEIIEKTPDGITGYVEFDLTETENMVDGEYLIDFGTTSYTFQVPDQAEAIFWDLNPAASRARV
jgi:hypothetical protein